MQVKKHFRIVCLKNEGTNRGISERNRHASIVMSERSQISNNNRADLQPSLAYLSARLQDEVKSLGIASVPSARETTVNSHSIKTIDRTEQIHTREKPLLKQTLDIEKYFEKKQLFLEESKNTMRNLMGSIDFQLNKKKQKRISKAIKSTINENTLGERKNRFFSKKYVVLENRTFMEGDFHSFLAKKQREKIALEKQLQQHQSQIQLQKLMIINPQKAEDLPSGQNVHMPLNLYHFQKSQGREQQSIRGNNSMGSKLHIEGSATDRRMLEKKMFEKKMFWLRPTLKTDAEDFEWSRIHDHKFIVAAKDQ